MKDLFNLTDYKIRSKNIVPGTIFSLAIITGAIFISEVVVDITATKLEIIIPFTIVSIVLVLLSRWLYDHTLFQALVAFVIYLMEEVHFLFIPTSFHTIIYWFPFVPFVALFIIGLWPSVIMTMAVIVTHIFNYIYVKQLIGEQYQVLAKTGFFLYIGIIFILAVASVTFLLYNLMGRAYNDSKQKQNKIMAMKTQVEERKKMLENHQFALMSLSKDETIYQHGIGNLFMRICAVAAINLHVSRTSIWLFNDNKKKFSCKTLYETGNMA